MILMLLVVVVCLLLMVCLVIGGRAVCRLVLVVVVGGIGMIDVGHDGAVGLNVTEVVVVVVVVAVDGAIKSAGILGVVSGASIRMDVGHLLVVEGVGNVLLGVGVVRVLLLLLLLVWSILRIVKWGALIGPWLMTLCGPRVRGGLLTKSVDV